MLKIRKWNWYLFICIFLSTDGLNSCLQCLQRVVLIVLISEVLSMNMQRLSTIVNHLLLWKPNIVETVKLFDINSLLHASLCMISLRK